jgi:hypothetical protein
MGEDYPGLMSVDINVEKSRFGTLGRSTTFDLLPMGYDNLTTLIRLCKGRGSIRASGAWYYLKLNGEEQKFQGLAATYKHLSENPDIVSELTLSISNVGG